MPEYLSPGVYIEEIEPGPRPIEGVSTTTAGFLGVTLRGPQDPSLITSFAEFKQVYGGHLPVDVSTLPFAVEGFFQNGGTRCYIRSITGAGAAAMTTDLPAGADTIFRVEAIGPGEWANRIAAKIEPATLPAPHFKLTVMYWDVLPPLPLVDPTDPGNIGRPNRREPALLEVFDELSADSGSPRFYEALINSSSNLIRVNPLSNGATMPAVPLTLLAATGAGGTNGTAIALADYQDGLAGFETIQEISIVAAPDEHRVPSVAAELIAHCTRMRYRIAVLGSNPATDTIANIAQIHPPEDTSFAAFYFPRLKVFDSQINRDSLVPAVGHIAGVYANTDSRRGVFKAPANEVVVGATGLEFNILKLHQDLLNPRGVNCLRVLPPRGVLVWGARTCSSDAVWRYINVRRYLLFVEQSIEQGTQWAVFENNDEQLWARVRRAITQFLTANWRDGALLGSTPAEAFFVKMDRTTMTQDDIDNGRLIVLIGVAVVKPAEFVILRLTHYAQGDSSRHGT